MTFPSPLGRHIDLCWIGCVVGCVCITSHNVHTHDMFVHPGSLFRDRVFLSDPEARKLIIALFSEQTTTGGRVKGAIAPGAWTMRRIELLLAAQHNYADATMDSHCHPLWTIIRVAFAEAREGQVVQHPYLEIIRTLATTAPVCALVKPQIMDTVDKICSEDSGVSISDFDNIHRVCPVLARFLRASGAPCGPASLACGVLPLLSCMNLRAKAAFENGGAPTEVKPVDGLLARCL